MTDQIMKAEAGVFTLTGGAVEMKIHVPLPADHPMHNLVGRVASEWSHVEHFLDVIIWHLAQLDEATGACLTSQIMGSFGRITAIYALCINQKKDEKVLKQVQELRQKMRGVQDRRNRILHDAWYVEDASQQTEQFKSMAKDESLIGFHPVDEAFIKETLDKMARRLKEAGELMATLN
jgi:hypothetical protein